MLKQMAASQTHVNQQFWQHVTQTMVQPSGNSGGGTGTPGRTVQPALKVQKMMPADDLEAFLNAFASEAASLSEMQWMAVLIPCLVGSAAQAMNMLPAGEVMDYKTVWAAILNTLNLSPEAYWRWLRDLEFGLDYHPQFIGHRIQATCMLATTRCINSKTDRGGRDG